MVRYGEVGVCRALSVESLSRCDRGNGVVTYFHRFRDQPLQAPVAILLTACNANEDPIHEDLDGMAVQPTVLEIVLDGTGYGHFIPYSNWSEIINGDRDGCEDGEYYGGVGWEDEVLTKELNPDDYGT